MAKEDASARTDDYHHLMVEVARAFYLRNEPKTEIAERLGLSRFKVARLLDQARTDGVVRITIVDDTQPGSDIGPKLAEHLQLEECTVVAGGIREDDNRLTLAKAAAMYLERTVRSGDWFGLSWGRTLAQIGAYLGRLPTSTAVALTGGVGTDFTQSPVEVLRSVSGGSQIRTMSIFAPLLVQSPEVADGLRGDPAIASVLDAYRQLDLAVLSVGSWHPPITQLLSTLTKTERQELDRLGVRAEIAGSFIDDSGRFIDTDLVQRRIAVSPDELMAIPKVLAVAGGEAKVPALTAVARSRVLTALITDERTADLLLRTPPVPAGPRRLSVRHCPPPEPV